MRGSEEVLDALRRLPAAILNGIAEELGAPIEAVAEDARSGAAVDTGYMRDHIRSEVTREDDAVVAKVVSEADYSGFVELGTSKMAAQPFMLPAAYANAGRVGEAVATGARKGMEAVANGTA